LLKNCTSTAGNLPRVRDVARRRPDGDAAGDRRQATGLIDVADPSGVYAEAICALHEEGVQVIMLTA